MEDEMRIGRLIVLFLIYYFTFSFDVAGLIAQNVSEKPINRQYLDKILKKVLGQEFEVQTVFDVDKILSKLKVDESVAYIREDPNHQLQHTYIGEYTKWDSMPPKERYGSGASLSDIGGIAIIRDSNTIWCSKRFILDYSPRACQISGFADLNNDGVTDIIISTFEGEREDYEKFWLITPDDQGGRILNSIDKNGQTTIVGESGTFKITNVKNSKIMTIRSSNGLYKWNGSVFKKMYIKKLYDCVA
jgi:hypothetical protein